MNARRFLLFLGLVLMSSGLKALKPLRTYSYTPDSLGLNYDNLYVNVNDSTRLRCWKVKPAPAYDKKTCVIIANGDAGNMSLYVYHASQLVMKGYTVLCFDYRGFGESSDFLINEKNLYYNEYADDISALVKWCRTDMTDYKLGIWAFSMGTIVSAIAVQNTPVDFFIAEGLVYNPIVASVRLKLNMNTEVYLPEGAEKLPQYYSKIACKMLVFAGTNDLICTVSDAAKVCSVSKNRYLVKYKAGHLMGMEALSKKTFGDKYIARMLSFI